MPSFDGEAISLLGDTLSRPALNDSTLHERDSLLQLAFTNYMEDTSNLENIIWLGRRLAYLHRYQDAIMIFSKGLSLYPTSPELYRHRGHRLITIRRFDDAIADLHQGTELAKDILMAKEPDGIPNELNVPLSNLHFNLYYHLGLAHFFKADYPSAIQSFNACRRYADNPDLLVALTDWLYIALMRNGDSLKAKHQIEMIHPAMEIIENRDYLDRILLYKGVITEMELMDVPTSSSAFISRSYGLSCWYEWNERNEEAEFLRRQILQSDMWPAFSYIAAVADSRRKRE